MVVRTKSHELYTAEDFKDNSESKLAEVVIEGGLSVCRKCGEFEAGLDKPCTY
jgi:hypothetical protein